MAASRENQGYLIAIILMVLLIVVLAILTYFAFTQASAASSKLEGREKELATANSQAIAYQEQAAVLKGFLGIPPFAVGEVKTRMDKIQSSGVNDVVTETQTIQQQYEADMARYFTPTGEGVEKTYKGLLDDMSTTLMSGHRARTALTSQVTVANEEKNEIIAKKDEEIALVQQQLQSTRQALNTEKAAHDKTKASLNQQLANAKQAARNVNDDFAQAQKDWSIERQQLQSARGDAESKVEGLERKLAKYESKRFETSDGKVIRVAHAIDRVYVDMGSADRLQLRQSFSIFDQNSETFERGQEKAKIEIYKITGPHSSEARIVEDNPVNPILTGDHVITPTWDRGYSVPVALAGFFDLDGDGKSDLDRVRSMIRQNGGEVVAYNDDAGQIQGRIDEDTRYLVIGDDPKETEMIQAMSKLEDQGRDYVVQRVPVREYLNWMGLRIQSKVLEGTGTLNQRSSFPERQPPASNGGSAFDN